MTSRQYWKTRAILLEQLLHDRSEATAQRISRLYGLAQESIFQHIERVFASYVKGGALNEEKAMRLLSVRETEEAERELRALYETATGRVKRDIWARLSAPAYANRISRLQALRDRIYLQARMMGLEEVSYVRDRLSDTLEQSYYRTTFDIQHFTGEYYDFDRLTDRQIKAALATDWSGKNWSERIWDNNQMFADAVEDTVTVGIMTGQRYDEMRDNLLHVIGLDDTEGARYRSARLVQTECAYVANQGHLMGYQAAEIEKYIFLATLDLRTSKICRALDGKRFLVSEAQPGTNYPPMHPWCRSTTMPDMTAEQLRKVPRAARDPKTGKSITVPGDMTYQQWYEKFVEGTKDGGEKSRRRPKTEPPEQLKIDGWDTSGSPTTPVKTYPPNYEDISDHWYPDSVPGSHAVEDLYEYTVDGATYKVDGHNVKLDYDQHEKEIAELLEREVGGELYMVPKVNMPQGISSPDYLFNGEKYDLKTLLEDAGENTIFNRIQKSVKKGQADNFIIDVTKSGLTDQTILSQVNKVFWSDNTKKVRDIAIVRNMTIEKVFRRK